MAEALHALRALRDGSLKTEERLKVASALARYGNPRIPEEKVAFLTKWTCQEICNVYNKKGRSRTSTEVCSQLWLFLAAMMESEQHIRQQQQKQGRGSSSLSAAEKDFQSAVPVSIYLIQAMSDVLGSRAMEGPVNPVLSCLMHILKRSPPLPSVLYKFEVSVSLLLSVLVLATDVSHREQRQKESIEEKCGKGEELVDETSLDTVLCLLLDHFTYLQGTQGNQKKVFTAVCCQLLPPVISLRQSLLVSNSTGGLGEKLDILLQSLFSKDHLPEYSSALSHHSTTVPSARRSAVSYTKQVFLCLRELLDDASDAQTDTASAATKPPLLAVLSVIPTLFKGFLQKNGEMKKLSKGIEFNFFLKLLTLLGFYLSLPPSHTSATAENSRPGAVRKEGSDLRKKARVGEGLEESCESSGADNNGEISEGEGKDEGSKGEGVEEDEMDDSESENESEIDWEVLMLRIQTEGYDVCAEEDKRDPFLKVLVACLDLLHTHNVYQVIHDQANGNVQFHYLHSLCVELVKNTSHCNVETVAECLETVLQLNHKLVEPLMSGLLLLVSSTSDSRMKMESFFQKCISVYSKLRQLGVLVGKMFSAFEMMSKSSSFPSTSSPAFSKSSQEWFCRHVRELPVGQSVGLLEQLTRSFQSIFLEKIPLSSVDPSLDDRQRRKRRHSERERQRLSSTGAISSSFSGTLLRGVDVFSLVLLNTHLSLWNTEGMYRKRGMMALQAVKKDVHDPLMKAAKDIPALRSAALCMAHNLQSLLFCVRGTIPDPPTVNEDSTTSTAPPGTPQSLPVNDIGLVWNEEWHHPLPAFWGSVSATREEVALTAVSKYFLKAMTVQQVRFEEGRCSTEDMARFLDFIFDEVESTADDRDDIATWSGQPLDVNERNLPVAVWDLVLSSLPLIYSKCRHSHLEKVASFLHSALLCESVLEGGGEGCGSGGRTGKGVALDFFRSKSFQDMRKLQELVLSLCFEQTALSLPKSLKELKVTLMSCKSPLLDSSEHLCKAIEQGLQLLEAENMSKKRKSVSKSTQHLSVCLEVVRAIPMTFTHPEVLQRCVLCLAISHIALVHLLGGRKSQWGGAADLSEMLSQLKELQLVMAWVVLSLVHCDRVGKKKLPRQVPLPFPKLLTWLYAAAKHCTHLDEEGDSQLWTSSLLLLEAAMEAALKTGRYPAAFVRQVVGDVSAVVTTEDPSTTESNTLSTFYLTVTKLCKTYSGLKPSQREGSVLHEPLRELLGEMVRVLSQLRKKSPERVVFYPQLVSSFCLLFRSNPPSDSADLSKCVKLAKLFSDLFCSNESLHSAIRTSPSILCAVTETLSLAAIQTEGEGDTRHTLTHTTVTDSWSKMMSLLKTLIDSDLTLAGECLMGMSTGGWGSNASYSGSDSLKSVNRVLSQFSRVMTRLLAASNREQTASIFQLIHNETCDSPVAALAVCHCWSIILSARLQSESQRELRKWHIKLLLLCEALTIQHRGDAPVVIMSLSITTRLVSLPTRVGLDSRLVLMSLHQTAILGDVPKFRGQRCMLVLQSVAQLLYTVMKNHSSVSASCLGPVITAINHLVGVVLKQCKVRGEEVVEEIESETRVANTISRIFDHLSSQHDYTKYISCVVSSYMTTVVQSPPTKAVKTSLLPGVYALLRQCSEDDTASIHASLDATTGTQFQSLVENFRKQKRFL